MKLVEAINIWIVYRAQLADLGSIAPSTCAEQKRIAMKISTDIGEYPLADIRKSHLDLWTAERRQSCAAVTIQTELNILRQILNWCVDERYLDSKPRFPTIHVPNIEQQLPSDQDFIWYLALLPQRTSEALEFMLLTGLAPHELERLQVEDYDPEAREIVIGEREDFRVKAEARRRHVPLNERARSIWRCKVVQSSCIPKRKRVAESNAQAILERDRRACSCRWINAKDDAQMVCFENR